MLKGIEAIEITYAVYGVHDTIAEVKADSTKNLRKQQLRIRGLNKVRSTLTMIAIERI